MLQNVNGIGLHYEMKGSEAPALLFLHGLGASSQLWHPQVRFFSGSFKVIAPTLRGHPPSEEAAIYSIAAFTGDAAGLLDALKVKRCVVIGSSAGAGIALALAAELPEIVCGVVTVSGFARTEPAQTPYIEQTIERIRAGGIEAVAARLADLGFSEATHAKNPGLVGLHCRMLLGNRPEAYLEFWRMMLDYDVTEVLGRVKCPALIVFGPDDKMVDCRAQTALQQALPQGRLRCISETGHHPQLEKPGEFNAALMEFVAAIAWRRCLVP